MAVKVRLTEGIEVVVHSEVDALVKALDEARAHGTMVTVSNNGEGELVLNPDHVLYLEAQPASVNVSTNGVVEAMPTSRLRGHRRLSVGR